MVTVIPFLANHFYTIGIKTSIGTEKRPVSLFMLLRGFIVFLITALIMYVDTRKRIWKRTNCAQENNAKCWLAAAIPCPSCPWPPLVHKTRFIIRNKSENVSYENKSYLNETWNQIVIINTVLPSKLKGLVTTPSTFV